MVTVEEFSEPFDRMVIRFDANGDGGLTLEELQRRGEHRGDRDGDREREGGDRDD
jgi:hypothetical protein